MTDRFPFRCFDPEVPDGTYSVTVVNGVPSLAQIPGGAGSGVVQTIVPGTGIAVDDADPANPIVSATGTGGGGSGGALVTVDDPSIWTPDLGYDCEFDRAGSPTTPPSGWSWKDQGATSYVEQYGGGAFSAFPAGVFNTRGFMRDAPTETGWTMTAKVSALNKPSNGFGFGLFLHNTASNKTIQHMIGQQLGNNSFVFLLSGNAYAGSLVEFNLIPTAPRYLQIVKHGATSYDFSVSVDGIAWYPIVTGYNVSTQFTPDKIGIGGLNWGDASVPVRGSCEWLRVR